MRVRNFKQCAEETDRITITAEHEDGFSREVDLLIEAPHSIDEELVRMLQTDRVELLDLTVEQSCVTLVVRIL